jgi:hypothetical protein
MHRRLLVAALGCWPAARVLAGDEAAQPHQKISARALSQALAARFPLRFALADLLDVQVDAPRLQLLAARQRLAATVPARVRDMSSQRVDPWEVDLQFAVRYEPGDRTLRAHQIDIVGLRSPALAPQAGQQWQALLASVVRGAVDDIVLHRFTRDELALPDSLGVQPRRITVEDDALVIWFG